MSMSLKKQYAHFGRKADIAKRKMDRQMVSFLNKRGIFDRDDLKKYFPSKK